MGESGAYPLNPGVIDNRQVAPSLTVPTSVYRSGPDSHSETMQFICPTFHLNKRLYFVEGYKEGFDLPNLVYRCWLSINYPEDAKSSVSLTTHITGEVVHTSDTASDVFSDIFKLPSPKPPKRKGNLALKQ